MQRTLNYQCLINLILKKWKNLRSIRQDIDFGKNRFDVTLRRKYGQAISKDLYITVG